MATAAMATAAIATTVAAAAMPSRLSSAYIDDQRQRDDSKNFCKFRHRRTSNVTPRKLIFIRSH
jgi:Spy/CpxP family protein refolding chaperone